MGELLFLKLEPCPTTEKHREKQSFSGQIFFDVKIVWQNIIFWESNSKLLNWKWYELNLFYLREITSDFLPSFLKCTDKKLPLNLKYYASSL